MQTLFNPKQKTKIKVGDGMGGEGDESFLDLNIFILTKAIRTKFLLNRLLIIFAATTLPYA